jgi:aspartate racemase
MHRVVGIIGGMGPEATVDLMRRVVAKTPAQDDVDHIHLIVESNPKIPSRIAHLVDGKGADPTPELIRIAANLQRAGADALAIPCNTAHAYADSIRRAVSIPLLDMVSLTVDWALHASGSSPPRRCTRPHSIPPDCLPTASRLSSRFARTMSWR